MASIKIKFTLCKSEELILVKRYCIHGTEQWTLVREELQSLEHHTVIANKEPTIEAIREMQRQRTITLFLTQQEAHCYINDTFSNGSISDELSETDEPSDQSSAELRQPSVVSSQSDPMSQVFQQMMAMQMESFKTMLKAFQDSIAPMARTKNQKMEVTKFDGKSEDAKTWIIGYEKACEFNGWSSDDAKVNNLKSYLECAALKWFNSRILEKLSYDWSSWKESFLDSFGQNRVTQASRSLAWEYRGGSLLDFYYEKQRLLQLAFPELDDTNFITLMLISLPDELQKQINYSELQTKEEFRRALIQLKPTKQKEQTIVNKTKSFKAPERNRRDAEKLFCINETSIPSSPGNVFNILVNGNKAKALFDSGAHVDLISKSYVDHHKVSTIPYHKELQGFNKLTTSYDSAATVSINYNGVETELMMIVDPNLDYDLLIGIYTLKKLGLIWSFRENQIYRTEEKIAPISSLKEAQQYFPSLFKKEVTQPKVIVDFKLAPGAPVIQSKAYRLSSEKFSWAQEKIKELLAKQIIVPSTSSFASPCVIVPKESGALRLCQDYRELNRHSILDPFPFPIIDDIINSFGGCSVFSKLDLQDGFWQIGLSSHTRHQSAFVLPFGHYEMTRLPFGWRNSPPIFQREMTKILGDLLELKSGRCKVALYIDDICIGGLNKEENAELTGKVLARLQLHGFKVNENKCIFGAQSVTFLGRVIDGKTKTTREESIDRVLKMKKPFDLHSLRCFTGLTGHFRAFIPKYAELVRPLDKLKQKDVPFIWSSECENAYQQLVQKISSNPILNVPDWDLKFELSCDASYYGTGAILYQRDTELPRNKQLRVIGYYSYTFTKTELNYSVTEKECLAVIKAIGYFRSYIEGREFTVNTDHQALTHLMTLKEPKNRLGRWQANLMTFNMKINHRAGKELTDADALSRLCPDVPTVNTVVELRAPKVKVNPDQIQNILKYYHDDPYSGGHDGISRTFHKISSRFYWSTMREDITNYVRTCELCQKTKAKFKQNPDPMILPKHSEIFFEVIHLDYGEISKKKEGAPTTKSFLVIVDEATRLCQAVPMKEDADSLINFFKNHELLKQIKVIITDNGKSFTAKKTLKFFLELGIRMKTTSPYAPWSNGLAERYVQKIKLYYELYSDLSGGWKKVIVAAAKHNNRAYNRALGCSPYFKAFNKVDWLPADELFGVASMIELTEKPFSKEQQNAYREKMRNNHNKNIKSNTELRPGDKVLVFKGNKDKYRKLHGPYVVKDVKKIDGLPKTVIYLEDGEEKIAHFRNVKAYHSRGSEASKKGGVW